jgi:hypothetical protein
MTVGAARKCGWVRRVRPQLAHNNIQYPDRAVEDLTAVRKQREQRGRGGARATPCK